MNFAAIEKVLTQLEAMERQVLSDNIFRQVQTLVKILPDAIDEIKRNKNSGEYARYICKTKLCASQLCKALPVLISTVTGNGVNPSFREITEFLMEKIRWCLLEVLRVFRSSTNDQDKEPSGIFVASMDYAINYIQNDKPVDHQFRVLVDDLLCQSLTIAKLSSNTDYQDIAIGCKNVLVKLTEMESNEGLKSFKKDLLLSSLECLERKVNTAVLRMYLHVMSEPFAPIKSFAAKCLGKKLGPRQPSDLNPDIVQLDHYCDQIQTIGNFAVACTESLTTKLKVQCCLASLEFIENYFIPTATAFYMDSTNIAKRNFFKFLVEESQKELKSLQILLDNIVDSTAFAQVVDDDLTVLAQNIKESILDGIYSKKEAETFLFRSFRLVKHLHNTDDQLVKEDPKIKTATVDLEKLLYSLQYKIQDNLFSQSSVQSFVHEMDLIVLCASKISQVFNNCNEFSFSFSSLASRGQASKRNLTEDNFSLLLTSDTEVDEEHKTWIRNKIVEDTSRQDTNINSLEPYLVKVAETPRKLTLFAKTPSKFTPCQPKIDKYSSYNVTDVLEHISGLSDTFFETDKSPRNPTILAEAFGFIKEMNAGNQSSCHSTSNESYDTAHRIEDISFLDKKISNLKAS